MNYYLNVWNNYTNFSGRARRSEYWYFVLFNNLISLGLIFFVLVDGSLILLNYLYTFAVLIPNIAVSVRRMHDVGKSGWFILIPIYNLILCLTEGDRFTNEYGPDPKQPVVEEMVEVL